MCDQSSRKLDNPYSASQRSVNDPSDQSTQAKQQLLVLKPVCALCAGFTTRDDARSPTQT